MAIVDAIIEAPARGWTAGMTLAEAAAGLGALAIFVRWDLRTAHPLIDLRIFASRAFSAAAASVTVIFFALFGSLFVLTQYLQLVHGYSPLSAGVRALPFALAMGAVSPVSPVLARRLGTRVIIPAGMTLMGPGLLDLSTAGVHTSYPALALAVATMGAGMGLVMARPARPSWRQCLAARPAPAAPLTTRSGKPAAPWVSRSSAASPPPRTGHGSPARSPRRTCQALPRTSRQARSPPPASSADGSAARRAPSWPARRAAPSSPPWTWECESNPAGPHACGGAPAVAGTLAIAAVIWLPGQTVASRADAWSDPHPAPGEVMSSSPGTPKQREMT